MSIEGRGVAWKGRSTARRNSAERNWPTLSPTEQPDRAAGGKSGRKIAGLQSEVEPKRRQEKAVEAARRKHQEREAEAARKLREREAEAARRKRFRIRAEAAREAAGERSGAAAEKLREKEAGS